MVDTRSESAEREGGGATRRERLERIATAERDRRAGRPELSIAAVGEPVEWPARVVLALAVLPEGEGRQARELLQQGLDDWARDLGLAPLDPPPAAATEPEPVPAAVEPPAASLDRPLEPDELEQAFAEAEAEVDAMHDVNRVAERVLMDEQLSLAEAAGDELTPLAGEADALGMDAASALPSPEPVADGEGLTPAREGAILATLERWLRNLERRRAGRMQ